MANRPQANLSSVFDGMLTQNKKRFDDLYHGSRGGLGELGKAAAVIFGAGKITAAAPRPASSADLEDDSAAARRLRERFGDDWDFEIKDRHRDGDEAIVLGKLTFGKAGAVRTQFGRAKISSAAVAGASGGVQFRIGDAGGARDEQDAFRRAAEVALANCVDLI
jgi:hypothetical protein